jgi:hypothetical protein
MVCSWLLAEIAGSRLVAEFDRMAAQAQLDNHGVELGDEAANGDPRKES